MCEKAGRFGCHDIARLIVDEQGAAWIDTEALLSEHVNRRVRFCQLLDAGNDDILEEVENGSRRAEQPPELPGKVGYAVERNASGGDFANQLDHARDRLAYGFKPAGAIGSDKLALLGKTPDKLRARFLEGAARVVLVMPLTRDDAIQKPVQPMPVRDQLLIEIADVPIVQDVADIENDGIDVRRTKIGGGADNAAARSLTLARLETTIRLVDDVHAAAAPDHPAVPVTVLQRLYGVTDFHGAA